MLNPITGGFIAEIEEKLGCKLTMSDIDDYDCDLKLIFIQSGGSENLFLQNVDKLKEPYYLLTNGSNNSLAASLEIMTYITSNGKNGEILHGDVGYVADRIKTLIMTEKLKKSLGETVFGVMGHPSDWLISSGFDREAIFDRLGINLQYIPMEELLEEYSLLKDELAESWKEVVGCHSERSEESTPLSTAVKQAIPGAYRLYKALKTLISDYGLSGLTIRCFDLLTAVHNTGCLALARLNSEGYVAGCEGDVPAMISMMIGRAVTGVSGFQANPSSINPDTGEMVFSHCTVPLDMVSGYGLDTHFESGIGVGIRGNIPEGPVTVFKVSGNISRHFVCEGELLRCEAKPDLCRTQAVLHLPPAASEYFLTEPIGNHHIILPGHVAAELEALLSF